MRILGSVFVCIAVLACASTAQLVSRNGAADSVRLEERKPLVLTADSLPANIQALDDSISTVNADPSLGETAKSMAIYKGLEMLGESIKKDKAPNSAEADAAERALEYR